MEVVSLLKAKIERIAKQDDQALLDFLSIVFCCDGKVAPHAAAFHYYMSRWGQEKFEEVKRVLTTQEALLQESPEGIRVNYAQPEAVAQDLGDYLFEQRLSHYSSLLSEIMATPEGSYFLVELAKAGPHIGEEDLAHISKVIGGVYYNQIYEAITKNSLLIWLFSSRKHEYFRLLPQLRKLVLLEDVELRDALAFIYIAQGIREEAGVLVHDCAPYNKRLPFLLARCAIRETRWYSLQGFHTTATGDALIRPIIGQRLETSRPEINALLDSLPKGALRYLVEQVALGDDWEGRFLRSPVGFFRDREEFAFCLLDDNHLRSIRDRVLNKFIELGLATIASSYVSTKGGRIDEPTFVLAPELKDALRDYLNTRQFAGPLLPADMEKSHALFHILGDFARYSGAISRDQIENRAAEAGISVKEAIESLCNQGLLRIEDDSLRVVSSQRYQSTLVEKFRKPIVDYLLSVRQPGVPQGEAEIEPPPIQPPAPTLPFEITFSPYDDGKALVFGRGELGNKIAWGFEAGKPLSAESLVTSDLYDINQPHVGSFQQTRTGKSTLASCVILQVAFQGVPVVVIDPKPDYVSNLIPVSRTIASYPEHRQAIEKRFKETRQDIRGFDFTREIKFEHDGKPRRMLFQVYSFDKDLRGLPNCRVLKLPLLVLPPLDDADFEDQCNAAATSLVNCLPLRRGKALNTLLADVMRRFKRANPESEFMLKKDIQQELESIWAEADKEDRKRIKALLDALNDYYTENSYLYAANEAEVVRIDSVVRNPEFEDGDQQTVSVSVIDVSALPQEKRNPVMMNYISQVCGQLYSFVRRKRSDKPVQLFIVFDEAQNYLPDPSDQYNYARVIINRGASLGIKAWLMAQSPQAVEKEARKQFTALVLSKVNESSVRDEVSKYVQDDSWTGKLKHTELGKALIVNAETGKEGGRLCVVFTTPQTVNIPSPRQIARALHQG
ncbi:MAG TPA: hypothetical protein G4O03_01630 [Dehalococcoidia bacterium]|jgi:hypothetical protein|nr:hypothetical protein [Dehalococcoidia bacterium]